METKTNKELTEYLASLHKILTDFEEKILRDFKIDINEKFRQVFAKINAIEKKIKEFEVINVQEAVQKMQ